MARKNYTNYSDEVVADLLRQHLAHSDQSLDALNEQLHIRHFQLKRVIRSLPTEFGLYNIRDERWVKYFQGSAGTQARVLRRLADAVNGCCSRTAGQHLTETLFMCCLQAAGNRQNGTQSNNNLYCSVCDQSFQTASDLQQHKNSARHKVNVLNQQLKSSGSFHANLQGLQVSEFQETASLEVGWAASQRWCSAQPTRHLGTCIAHSWAVAVCNLLPYHTTSAHQS